MIGALVVMILIVLLIILIITLAMKITKGTHSTDTQGKLSMYTNSYNMMILQNVNMSRCTTSLHVNRLGFNSSTNHKMMTNIMFTNY